MVTKVWGLTGGIASGKSTAAQFFLEAQVPIIDADRVSRELSEEGGLAHSTILKRFGTTDRTKLRDIVFKDFQARKELEGILHPLIVQESSRLIVEEAQKGASLVIYEASLLVETGRYKDFEGLIVVDCERAQRVERLIKRSHISRELADKMMSSQISDEIRLSAATKVFKNNATLEELRQQVLQFLKDLD